MFVIRLLSGMNNKIVPKIFEFIRRKGENLFCPSKIKEIKQKGKTQKREQDFTIHPFNRMKIQQATERVASVRSSSPPACFERACVVLNFYHLRLQRSMINLFHDNSKLFFAYYD